MIDRWPGLTVTRMRGRNLLKRNVRLAQLQPFCQHCRQLDRYRIATQTDHIVALCNGGTDDESNLQRLCDECHLDKTARDMKREPRQRIGIDGWPIGKKGAGGRGRT